MTFLPVVDRELRQAARRPITYWTRSLVVTAMLLVGMWMYLTTFWAAPQMVGKSMFGVMSGLAMFASVFCGTRLTADCISREKREGTLGLLFLTDLRGHDVVLGKMAASSLNVFYALLAIVPILALPLLMGGVSVLEFSRMAVVCITAMLMSLSIGMLASTVSRDARKAVGLTVLILVVVCAGLPMLGALVHYKTNQMKLAMPFYWASPWFAYGTAYDMSFRAQKLGFLVSLFVSAGLGLASLVASCWLLPRCWQDRARDNSYSGLSGLIHRLNYGSKEARARLRGELLDVNPFMWLSARSTGRSKTIWLVLGLLALGWFWGYAEWKREWLNEGIYVTTGIVLSTLLKGWLATEASRSLAEQREQGTMELLLCTPLSVPQILKGQALSLQRLLLGPTVLILVIGVILFAASTGQMVNQQDRSSMILAWICGAIVLVADLVAIYWVGMWQGLNAASAQKASTATVLRILVLPWVVLILLLSTQANSNNVTFDGMVITWVVISLVTDFAFGAYSRSCLLERFREVATHRFEKRSWIAELFRMPPAPPAPANVPPVIGAPPKV